MKLIFFDESKNDPEYFSYHLGAVCIDESELINVEAAMQEVAVEVFGTSELSDATEFHACEIYHRNKNFKKWDNFDRRIEILGKLTGILSMGSVQRIDIQINCNFLHEGQNAEDIAFMFLCERANDLLRAQKSIGMLIGDRESDRHAARFATTLSNYRATGTDFAYGREIKNLVDSVHFTQSHLSRFLQLADIYVWLLQFRKRNQDSTNIRHQAVFNILKLADLSPSKYKEWPKS